jgi:hypothetical protein
MKTMVFPVMLGCVLQASLEAQTNSQPASANTNVPAATVVARSGSSRTWARITSRTNAAGRVSFATNTAYIELGSGLCYKTNGQWVDSVAQIGIVADGASATQAQHTVHFAGNANTAGGAIHLVAPDGKVFDSRVYGLAYRDRVSGTNVLLAPLQDCQGTVVGSNRVVYADAFNGLKADIEYVLTKAGLEQNVILREQPPVPEYVAVGLSSASTRLEVLSEFFSPPAPTKKRSLVVGDVEEDTVISFGGMGIGMGKAFFTQGQNGPTAAGLGRVSKHWTALDGRDFLIEEVPYAAISNAVQNLPLHASAAPAGTAVKRLAALEPLLPKEVASAGAPKTMKLSESMPRQAGLVLDYTVILWSDMTFPFVFQSDTTYYILSEGGVYFQYTPSFEGGTVVKFDPSAGALQNAGDSPFNFNGSSYRPVVFTSSDDDNVGDAISGSSGNPWQSWAQTFLVEENGTGNITGVPVAHVRLSYASTAYEDWTDLTHVFRDCQFKQCGLAWYSTLALYNDTDVYLQNDLMTGCSGFLHGYITVHGEQITVDFIENQFIDDASSGGGITNSILTGCDDSIYQFTLDHTAVADSGSGIYQSTGDGYYYLAPYTYQGAGTTQIDPSLLADLQTKTTCPPVVYAEATISGDTTLGITLPRDTCNPGPDYGYHYDPIDYAFGGTTVNANLTFTPGTVVAWYNDGLGYGIVMANGKSASFQGTATTPVWWIRANTVQEESGAYPTWPGSGAVGGLIGQGNTSGDSPQAKLLFTHCSILGKGDGSGLNHFADDGGYLTVGAMSSEFYDGMIGGYALSCYFTNCLMDRMVGGQYQGYPGNAYILQNCTWHGGRLTLTPSTPIPLVVRDSSFDGTTIWAAGGSYAYYDYNAFTNGAGEFPIGGNHDVLVSGGFNWQSSVFGNYYLPVGSPLIAAGDVTANQVGLSAYTTQTDQAPEGNATVDLGYHYLTILAGNITTNCDAAPGGVLNVDSPSFCVGATASDGATWTGVPGQISVNSVDSYGNVTSFDSAVYSAVVASNNVVNWNGAQIATNGSSFSFMPTTTGWGTSEFYFTYVNPTPCSPGPYTISITNTFAVVGVASLAPPTSGTCVEIANSTPGTRTFLVQANPASGQNTLAVYATPSPSDAATNLPSCWSLNGLQTTVIGLNISTQAVYQVDCVCGTSALTNFIVVTTNAVTANSTVDTTCGTGPSQLGYWSFNNCNNLLDYWTGGLNALDSAGTNNGTTNGNVTYASTTNNQSGYAFSFDGSASYISFGTNAGNFGTNDFTIDFWMKTTASGQQRIILGKRQDCVFESMWNIFIMGAGDLGVELCQDSSGTFYDGFRSQWAVNNGIFHHIQLTRQGRNVDLFVDGMLDTAMNWPGIANLQNSAELMAGNSPCIAYVDDGYFEGLLDEIKLWSGQSDNGAVWTSSSRGWPPLQSYNVQNPATPWTNGLLLDSISAAKMAFNYLEADGSANLNGAEGAVQFWFSPDWTAGMNMGAAGYLFELGDVSSPGGGWALETDSSRSGLSFVSGSNGVLTTNFTAPIAGWLSNQWHQIVLSYSPSETLLFIDGGLVTAGAGLAFEPDLATRLADGFTLGSDHNGEYQARGVFDELTTYNCPLDSSGNGLGNSNGGILCPNGGLVNTGQMTWILNPANGLSSATGLEVFTPLH